MQNETRDQSEEVRGLIRAARAAVRLGEYEAARTTFERAVSLDPDNTEARDGLRDAQRRVGMAARVGADEQIEYCYRHPETETGLHCVQCARPICARCSNPAAVGQLCPECRRGRRAPNYQVSTGSLAAGAAVAFVVSAIVSAFLGVIPFGIFLMFFIAPAIAEFVVRAIDRVTRAKRGRPVQIAVGVALVAGALASAALSPLTNGLVLLLYLALVVGTAVARLR